MPIITQANTVWILQSLTICTLFSSIFFLHFKTQHAFNSLLILCMKQIFMEWNCLFFDYLILKAFWKHILLTWFDTVGILRMDFTKCSYMCMSLVFPSCDIYRTELFQCRKKCHSNILHLKNSTVALLKIIFVYSCFKYMLL